MNIVLINLIKGVSYPKMNILFIHYSGGPLNIILDNVVSWGQKGWEPLVCWYEREG